ncbi:MAG TPA: RNA polymerase sigma factor [Planctomycetota bacterium]|nr:RNA polymerase sigma factor [Planctomycetota bacterium]
MNDTDRILLQQFANGRDADAFARIVERYQDLVYCTCLRILGNAADAQDATQDCFLRLLRKAGSVESSLAGWLHRCAMVVAIDELRSRAARRTREEIGCQMKANSDPSWHELAPHLDQALDELPDDLRAIVIEHFLQRRTQAEIASELGVSPTTVARRLDTALDALRTNLKKAGVIVSAGLLAALITENAVQAAPASVAAALSKMSILAAAESGAPAAPAPAVGARVGGAIKGHLVLAAAMISILAGIGIFVVAARPGQQPPAQPQAAAPPAVGSPAVNDPKTPSVDPLLLALPEDALFLMYVPNERRMLENVMKLTPSIQGVIDQKMSLSMVMWGLTSDMVDAESSTAGIIVPGDVPWFAEVVQILRPKDLNAIIAMMDPGGPDADGIYCRSKAGNLTRPNSDVYMLPWKGYAAFSEKKPNLKWLKKTGGKTWMPSADGIRLMDGRDGFVHVNPSIAAVLDNPAAQQDNAAEGQRGLSLLGLAMMLAGQTAGADFAVDYGEAGGRISGLVSMKPGSMIAQYLTPSPGLDTLEPKLPALPGAAIGVWARTDKPTMDRLLGLFATANDMLMKARGPRSPQGVTVISTGLRSLLAIQQRIGGSRFGVVFQPVPRFVEGVGALELAKPEEFRALFQQRVDALNKELANTQGDQAPHYEYKTDAAPAAGQDTTRIDYLTETNTRISLCLGIAQNYLLMASGGSNLQQCAQSLSGRDEAATFAGQPVFKAALDRIGTGHNVVALIDIIPFVRPQELSKQGPIAIGLKALKGNVLAVEAFVSREAINWRAMQQPQ